MGNKQNSRYKSSSYVQWKMISNEDVGILNFLKSPELEDLVIEKDLRSLTFDSDIKMMKFFARRIESLPEEIINVCYFYQDSKKSFKNGYKGKIYFPFSKESLLDYIKDLRAKNLSVEESEVWALLGFLIGIGNYLEQNFEFHHSISLKNLLILEGKVMLVNPYLYDSHFESSLDVNQSALF